MVTREGVSERTVEGKAREDRYVAAERYRSLDSLVSWTQTPGDGRK